MACMKKDWSNLPEHILVSIFSSLRHVDRGHAGQVCCNWRDAFKCSYLWRSVDFWFYMPKQARIMCMVDQYGEHLRRVYIELDQAVPSNREAACTVLKKLSEQTWRRLQYLTIRFTGDNPLLYGGKEFVDALTQLFGEVPKYCTLVNQLKMVDLSGLSANFDDNLFNLLSANHPDLESLNIQNRSLVCKVTPICMIRLVQRCGKLQDLHVFYCSISEDVLLALMEADRKPLKHLSLICRRDEKFTKDIGDDIWHALAKKLPNLKVTLMFDHTCPLHKVNEIMKPSVPVNVLRLETFTYIYDEVRQASRFYNTSLVKLVLQTPLSRNSPELNSAVIDFATQCTKLRAIHIFCILEKKTVEKVLELHPHLLESNAYTLHCEPAPPHPWKAGADC